MMTAENCLAINIVVNTVVDQCREVLNTSSPTLTCWVKKQQRKRMKRALILQKYGVPSCRVLKVPNFIEVIYQYSDDTFYSHFRMKRLTFQKLEKMVKNNWKKKSTRRPSTSAEYALYMTLWYLANRTTYRDISDRFNVSKGCAFNAILSVCQIIYALRNSFISWPTDTELKLVENDFKNLRSRCFPGVVGCIDCTHIGIPAPTKDVASYYDRKGNYSIILQAVCDSNLVFRDIFFGWPGRSHDASVWRSSPLHAFIEEGKIIIPNNYHLLGDSAYPLSNYMMVPFKDNGFLSRQQKNFNVVLSSTRVCIEQAFGIVKNKFPVLKYLRVGKLCNCKYFVTTCISLHNFIIKEEGLSENEVEQAVSSSNQRNGQEILESNTSFLPDNDAKTKRNQISVIIQNSIY